MAIILAVDDDLYNLDLIKDFLSDTKHQVITATDGAAGLRLLRSYKVDLVLLDRMMPEMYGIAFMRKMKEDKGLADIPVIMQTAADGIRDMEEGLRSGIFHYLTKPFTEKILKRLVGKALKDPTLVA